MNLDLILFLVTIYFQYNLELNNKTIGINKLTYKNII